MVIKSYYFLAWLMIAVSLAVSACTASTANGVEAVSISPAAESAAIQDQSGGQGAVSDAGALSTITVSEKETKVSSLDQRSVDDMNVETSVLAEVSTVGMEASLSQDPDSEPAAGSEEGAVSTASVPVNAAIQTGDSDGNLPLDGPIPLSEDEQAQLSPDLSPPGAAGGNAGSEMEPREGDLLPSGTTLVYTSNEYKFAVTYPADFVVHSGTGFAQPLNFATPDASFSFMNPTTAASDDAQSEVGDLEIRIYSVGQISALNDWLGATSYLEGKITESFQTANVSGLLACASTMIAPSCDYFVYGNGWVYQLTPATRAGHAMQNSFRLIP